MLLCLLMKTWERDSARAQGRPSSASFLPMASGRQLHQLGNLDPEVLQSGIGLIFCFGLANLSKIAPANFSVSSSANFSRDLFDLVSPGLQAPKNISPENSRPKLLASANSQMLATKQHFSHADFLLTGETKNFLCSVLPSSVTAVPELFWI